MARPPGVARRVSGAPAPPPPPPAPGGGGGGGGPGGAPPPPPGPSRRYYFPPFPASFGTVTTTVAVDSLPAPSAAASVMV